VGIQFKPIVKGKPKTYAEFQKVIEAQLNAAAKDIQTQFQKTTAAWDEQVTFRIEKKGTDTRPVRLVLAENDVYYYVARGTERHLIEPRQAKFLRFATGYTPKTRPGVIGSFAGGPTGPVVFAGAVEHPGSEARNFDKLIATDVQKRFPGMVLKAIDREAQR